MLTRRNLVAGLAVGIATRVSGQDGPKHDQEAVRAEFMKILTIFNAEDVTAFINYGPPTLMLDGHVIKLSAVPEFMQSFTHSSSSMKKDERPAWLEGALVRDTANFREVLYNAVVARSVWVNEACEFARPTVCIGPDYLPRREYWRVFFAEGRITKLHRWRLDGDWG